MSEVFANGTSLGEIRISNDVLAIIAGTATHEVEGIYAASKNFARGVKVSIEDDGTIVVNISIMVKFGYKIHKVSEEVQKRIVTALETMVGMKVAEVNVTVAGLRYKKAEHSAQNTKRGYRR
ncbi:MAG: Asp23/Gls24 family envelope stress response protein [Defluviitaleaceae bacterium]|nr:Asp23/Gls24 family envelope stress response protein [Defluviitaleaceae bacterium]